MIEPSSKTIGYFREASYKNWFPVFNNPDYGVPGSFSEALPHIIRVSLNPIGGSGFRYANVLKTVARVVVDEAPNGQPIVEKWRGKLKV